MIIDSGSSVCRVGLAGQSIPTCVFPSIVGRPRAGNQALQMLGTAHGEICVGAEAQRKRGVLALRHPVQQGIVRDWGDMESVWRHAFSEVHRASSRLSVWALPWEPLFPEPPLLEVIFLQRESFNSPKISKEIS